MVGKGKGAGMRAEVTKHRPRQVWRLSTGRCLRRLGKAHTAGISCVAFTKEGSQVVTGSFDHSVRCVHCEPALAAATLTAPK